MDSEIIIHSNALPIGGIGIDPGKREEILTNDEAAIALARSLVAYYEHIKGRKYWMVKHGMKFLVDIDEPDTGIKEIMGDYILAGEYELNTTRLFERIIKPEHVCVDVGASIGYFTILMGKLGKEVYAIEPIKEQCDRIVKNVTGNSLSNVEVINKALSSKQGVIKINGMAHGRDSAEAITLDSLNIQQVDIMKMDIDGSEPEALKGATETIKRSPNLQLVIEYYPEYIKKLGNNPKEMIDFLSNHFTHVKRIGGDLNDKCFNYYCYNHEN